MMSNLPEQLFESFPKIVFNSSVSFDDGAPVTLDWQGNDGVFTASANGSWRLEITRRTQAVDYKITAELDRVYDKVEFKYFRLDSMEAEHILPQTCFKGCSSRNLHKVSSPEKITGGSVISITNKGVTLQLSTPYQSGFPADFICTAENCLLKDIEYSTLVEYYGGTVYEFPILTLRESADGFAMLEEYAQENSVPGKEFKDPVCGWNSWDYYRWTITEDEVLQNARFIANDPVLSKHVKRIIIDDGWQYCYGEWEANHYFPSGMEYMAKELRKMNFVPGLWLAPGIVEPHARIAQMDYDMLARSRGGQPCLAYECQKRFGFVLDPTVEKSQKFLQELFRRYTDYGYGYFKIDFLKPVLHAFRRQDKLVRRDDIVHLIVDNVRKGTGDRAEILGCGYVFSSGAAGVDAVRIGADIHATWHNTKVNAPSVAARYWQNRKLWINDPDFAVCRAAHTSNDPDLNRLQACYVHVKPEDSYMPDKQHDLATFKENEPEVLLSIAIISGGVINLSDKMPLLNEKGLELCRKTVSAEPGEAGVALDLFCNELPERFVQKFKSGIRILAVNWQDDSKQLFSFDLAKCGVSADMKAADFWSGKNIAHDGKLLQFELEPHTCRLIEFRR
ncbi:MAG: alpha-galactosidase [Lentisphaeria bacterium]|nr:alpha-galactosidase [Lentisphaeria bacterium]